MESSVIFTATGFFLWSYFLSSACFCLLAKSEAVFIWVNFLQHCKHGKLHIYQFISFMHVSVIYDLLTVDKFLKYYVINDMCSFVHVACILWDCVFLIYVVSLSADCLKKRLLLCSLNLCMSNGARKVWRARNVESSTSSNIEIKTCCCYVGIT